MIKFTNAVNGMNLIGQGSKIMRFAFPSLIVAIVLQFFQYRLVHIPVMSKYLIPAGVIFLAAGFALWLPALLQLLKGFPKGKLVRTGVFGICRNPMYASFALFMLPGISLLTSTWGYFVVSLFVLWGINRYIKPEEEKLREIFGEEYEKYCRDVSRIIPFVKPRQF